MEKKSKKEWRDTRIIMREQKEKKRGEPWRKQARQKQGECSERRQKADREKRKSVWYAAAGIILMAAAVCLQLSARHTRNFADWYAHRIYPVLVKGIGGFSGFLPFSVVEIGLYVLAAGSLWYLVKHISKPGRLACRGIFLAGILLFSYMTCCGINYYAGAFSEYAGLNPGKYTREELIELCEYLTEKVNETAPELPQEGTEKNQAYRYQEKRSQWRQESVAAMQAAGEQFPVLGGYYPRPKEVAVSWILSVQQLCGIYSPFTIEANYNGDMPDYNIPHTMCHELSHLKGFMREDEANFIGYLACIASRNPAFQYSGYLTGWVYAGNALAEADMETYVQLHGKLCESARMDLRENSVFWERYEGKVAEAANQWNDTYLKMNNQADGVKSYGRMVDLMLAYRKAEKEGVQPVIPAVS